MMNEKKCWTGQFTCKVCKIEYVDSIYTTKDGMICNFGCATKKSSKRSHDSGM